MTEPYREGAWVSPSSAEPPPPEAEPLAPEAEPPPPEAEPLPAEAGDRPPDLRLARLHLRSGGLALARAELESMAGSGDLDEDGLLDLAEARWRTGDLIGAGDVAQTYLDMGGRSVVATVIAAETMAALGRQSEARRFVADAVEQSGGTLDPVFAGMPKLAPWPYDVIQPSAQPVGPLFGDLSAEMPAGTGAAGAATGGFIGLWGDAVAPDALESVDPGSELVAATAEIESGELDRASVRLALLLRASPAAAGSILAAIGDVRSPSLDLVRGDALRALGDDVEARRAYSSAIGSFRGGPPSGDAASTDQGPPAADRGFANDGAPADDHGAGEEDGPSG